MDSAHDRPFTADIALPGGALSAYDNHYVRPLSAMRGYYADAESYERVLYVPPGWAHRSVNTGSGEDLVTFFVYPGHAGHDYGSIESQGFRKLVVERDGAPCIVDNARWRGPEAR